MRLAEKASDAKMQNPASECWRVHGVGKWKAWGFLCSCALLGAFQTMQSVHWSQRLFADMADSVLPDTIPLGSAHNQSIVNLTEASNGSTTSSPPGNTQTPHIPLLPTISKPDVFPPVDEITKTIQNHANRTAAQFILDIAVVGFAKCGTSTMSKFRISTRTFYFANTYYCSWLSETNLIQKSVTWLGNHPGLSVPPDELTILQYVEPWQFVSRMYRLTGTNSSIMRGYKSPNDISNIRSMRLLGTFFPQTKLIIGLRHPIPMMESFYNFRIQNEYDMKPFETLVYTNMRQSFGVSWSRAEYHVSLANLGKTTLPYNTVTTSTSTNSSGSNAQTTSSNGNKNETTTALQDELDLFPPKVVKNWKESKFPPYLPNPVFLYDTEQLSDKDDNRSNLFVQDLEHFLGLQDPLPPPLHFKPGKDQPTDKQRLIDSKKIKICDKRYAKQRQILLDIGTKVQAWILEYFVKSPDVYISNPEHFQEIVRRYAVDPCE